jgi:hypothetical protein
MTAEEIKILRSAFKKSWSKSTTYPRTKEKWSPENPAFGQCAVTSLVINDLYGGKIVYNEDYHHFWNVLKDGTVIDLTKVQFGSGVKIKGFSESSREYILESAAAAEAKTPQRYKLLKSKVAEILRESSSRLREMVAA